MQNSARATVGSEKIHNRRRKLWQRGYPGGGMPRKEDAESSRPCRETSQDGSWRSWRSLRTTAKFTLTPFHFLETPLAGCLSEVRSCLTKLTARAWLTDVYAHASFSFVDLNDNEALILRCINAGWNRPKGANLARVLTSGRVMTSSYELLPQARTWIRMVREAFH